MAQPRTGAWIWIPITLASTCGVTLATFFGLRVSAYLGGPGISLYNIPAGSMFPSVRRGENVVALANAYRSQLPPRGQIVIFKFPRDETTDYIKRVVGLPGDRVQLRAGRPYINDQQVPRELAPDADVGKLGDPHLIIYRKTIPDSASHLIAEVGDDQMLDNTEIYVVPEGHVFMLGDNRDHSADSRVDVGFVPLSLLRDKPLFIYWSTETSRIGAGIE